MGVQIYNYFSFLPKQMIKYFFSIIFYSSCFPSFCPFFYTSLAHSQIISAHVQIMSAEVQIMLAHCQIMPAHYQIMPPDLNIILDITLIYSQLIKFSLSRSTTLSRATAKKYLRKSAKSAGNFLCVPCLPAR